MPRSAEPFRPARPLRLLAGAGLSLLIVLLIIALFQSIIAAAAGTQSRPVDLGFLILSSLVQAGLTTLFSLIVGIAVAWALNRLDFPGRRLVVALLSAAIVTPGIIIAFGLIAIWGRSGWLGGLNLPIFGLHAVIFAHVVLDASFAARLLLARLDTIAPGHLKTGQSLNLSALTRFRIIDWPMIRPSLPGLGAIIFLLAFTSFPIVLLLGGGPAVQTLEVAIYAAVRLDFDLNRAVLLAAVQLGICGLVVILSALSAPAAPPLSQNRVSAWQDSPGVRWLQAALLALAIILFVLPVLASLVQGLPALPGLIAQPPFWRALLTSLAIATASALLTLVAAWGIAAARATRNSRLMRLALSLPAYAYLAVPAVTLALGGFLLVRHAGLDPAGTGPAVVVLANVLLSLPYALATLAPPLDAIATRHGRLIASLNLSGPRQFTAVEWPLIAPAAGLVLALAFCFSLGDVGVIALFGTADFVTLPLLMLRALGAYRTSDAAGIAALLLTLTIAAFFLLPRLTERLAHAGR